MSDRITDSLLGIPVFVNPTNCGPNSMDELQETARVGDMLHDLKGDYQRNYGKLVCGGCPAKTECLQFALDNNEREGVWGGLTPDERWQLTRNGGERVA
jgi:hypothetical protein